MLQGIDDFGISELEAELMWLRTQKAGSPVRKCNADERRDEELG